MTTTPVGWTPTRPLVEAVHIEIEEDKGLTIERKGSNSSSSRWSESLRRHFPFGISLSSVANDHNIRASRSTTTEPSNGQSTCEGLSLTWKDLWVNVGGQQRSILRGVTGFARPGFVLAIMGPSGSGKSTLLDALAGRLGTNVKQKGDILVNGLKQRLTFGTSAYVTQDDTLMTTLTVGEAVYYSAELQLPNEMSRADKLERANEVIREMGLQGCTNTRIGGWSVKGISGGQKRRVSICIELLTNPRLLFLDEPTSGLDSAASYHVMSRIISVAQRDKRTVLASIHQPSSQVFQLFHYLCLLSSGRVIYFGPTSDAQKDNEQENGISSTELAIDTLAESYPLSETYQKVQQKIVDICNKGGGSQNLERKNASFLTQCAVLTRRSFVNMYRDLGYYWLRLAVYIALCICVGTIFHDIGHSYGSIQARGSMLMFVAAFLTFMAIGGFPSYVEDMKVFEKERLNGHYGVGAYVIGNTLSSIPFLLIISIVPGSIAYYLVGLQPGISHFVFFVLVIFVSMALVESLMMIVASIVPDFLFGIITGAGIQGLMILNGGFFRLPNDLPYFFWKYPMYYVAFHKYANQGFYKNEFKGLVFPNDRVGGPATIDGDEVLRDVWQVEMGYSKWVDLVVLAAMVVIYKLIFFGIVSLSHKTKAMLVSIKSSIKITPGN